MRVGRVTREWVGVGVGLRVRVTRGARVSEE